MEADNSTDSQEKESLKEVREKLEEEDNKWENRVSLLWSRWKRRENFI